MYLQVLNSMRGYAGRMACHSALYNWSLHGDVPERMAVKLVDVWPGQIESGRAFCEGALEFHGARMPVGSECWLHDTPSSAWDAHLHGFTWLRDLRALTAERGAGAVARTHAKMMIQSWCEYHMDWELKSWRPDIAGVRLAMWLSSYEFFSAVEFIEADDEDYFQELFFDSCMRQGRHLARAVDSGELAGVGAFQAAKGLLYAGIAFEGHEVWVRQALGCIEAEIAVQIALDGGHVSRSPAQLLEVLQILLDVRMALRCGDYVLPESIQNAIDLCGPALRFFKNNDRHLTLFNGAQEGDDEVIDSVLRQAGVRGKSLSRLPSSGFERMSLGRTHVIMDCGSSGFDGGRSDGQKAAPLAFEMLCGRERLFVNCGAHPHNSEWQDALGCMPAHSALTLNHKNVQGGIQMRGSDVMRQDAKDYVLVEAAHEGYVRMNGFVHTRRLYLCASGDDLRGEDVLVAPMRPSKMVDVAIRFHLHPKVMVSLISGGEEALIRMPGGVGWRFHHDHGCLALEDSVYLGQGSEARKSKQLVIYGQLSEREARVKWAVQREG